MTFSDRLRKYIVQLEQKFELPAVRRLVFPLVRSEDCAFVALQLDDGSVGLSYIDASAGLLSQFSAIDLQAYRGMPPLRLAEDFGQKDDIADMIGLAAVNAASSHAIRCSGVEPQATDDPFAGLEITKRDHLGMVGYFRPIVGEVLSRGASLTVVERSHHGELGKTLPLVTSDPGALMTCNKIFITATTILNHTLDEVLSYCADAEEIVVAGPTLGLLPDPLFDHGITRAGGRYVSDGDELIDALLHGRPWGQTTRKTLYHRDTYVSPFKD